MHRKESLLEASPNPAREEDRLGKESGKAGRALAETAGLGMEMRQGSGRSACHIQAAGESPTVAAEGTARFGVGIQAVGMAERTLVDLGCPAGPSKASVAAGRLANLPVATTKSVAVRKRLCVQLTKVAGLCTGAGL